MHDHRRFAHHRLDVYGLALDLASLASKLLKTVPRGNAHLADQLRRSSCATPLLIAEGANRTSRGSKRQRFAEARGECGEAAATVELLFRLDLISDADFARFSATAGRVAAMLTGLIKKFG